MSRTRLSGKAVAPTRIHDQKNYACQPSGWQTVSSVVGIPVGKTVTMTDEVVPSFHRRVREGEIFFNAMSRVETEYNVSQSQNLHVRIKPQYCPNGNLHEYRWGDGMHVDEAALSHGLSSAGCGSVISDTDIINLQSELSTRLLARRGAGEGNLYESLAEYKQVAGMLGNVSSRLNSFLSRKNTGKQVTDLAALWLTYRYGIRPAISDVMMIVNGLERKTGKIRTTSRVQGSLSDFSVENFTRSMSGWGTLNYAVTKNDGVTVRAMSLDELVATRAYNIGLSAKNLLTLPWERVPYSFVIDWFFNVGDYLGAIAPTFQMNQLGSCMVTTRTTSAVVSTQSFVPNTTNGWDTLQGISGTATRSTISKTRVGLAAPKLVIKSDFRFDNFTRVADAFSLIAVRLNKRFGSHGKKGSVDSFYHTFDFGALS